MDRPADGRETKTKTGIVILNRYGGLWSDELFETAEAALSDLKKFWDSRELDLADFKLAMGIQTTEVYRGIGQPELVPWPEVETAGSDERT